MEGFSALQRKHDKLAGQHTALMKLKDDNDEEVWVIENFSILE